MQALYKICTSSIVLAIASPNAVGSYQSCMRCIHQTSAIWQYRMHLLTCPYHSHMYRDYLQACKPLCLCNRKSARQVSVIKHSKPSPQGSHADQNTPANLPSSKPAALPSRSSSNSRLAPASHTGTDQSISPAAVLCHKASAHLLTTTAAWGHGLEQLNLPPSAVASSSATAHCVQEQRTSALCGQEDSSRQPFMVIHADSSAPTTTSLSNAADPLPEKPPQPAAHQQLPTQTDLKAPQAPVNTLVQEHAKVAQLFDGSSVNDQCSSSGCFDRLGTSQEVGRVRHMRRNPVSSDSHDTAASSSSDAAAAATAAGAQSASARQALAKDAMSSTVAQSDGVSDGVCNGSPTGSRATAASTSEGRAGLVSDAPCRDSGFLSKPSSRARAGAVAAGRQKKSKGASLEVSSWWLSACLLLTVSPHVIECLGACLALLATGSQLWIGKVWQRQQRHSKDSLTCHLQGK